MHQTSIANESLVLHRTLEPGQHRSHMHIAHRVGPVLSRGFALPSILIASVVMLMVLATAMQAVVASRNALNEQYYNQQAREAAESGQIMAKRCLTQNHYSVTWSDTQPLTPATDCEGLVISGQSAYVLDEAGTRTTFQVGAPTVNEGVFAIQATGTYQQLRTSNLEVFRSVQQEARLSLRLPVLISLDGGYSHGVGLTSDRATIYAWGSGYAGQLGNGDTANLATPGPVIDKSQLGGSLITQVEAGGDHSLALTDDGVVWTWGRNAEGELGVGDLINRSNPVQVRTAGTPMDGKRIVRISAGFRHSLAVDEDGQVYAWGRGAEGQLGNGSTARQSLPVAVSMTGALAGKRVASINSASHSLSTLAVTDDGLLYSWGRNGSGELGIGPPSGNPNVPVAVVRAGTPLESRQVKQAILATNLAYILTTDSTLLMMGHNNEGQAATGTAGGPSRVIPTQIVTAGSPLAGKTVTQLAADGYHVLALADDGSVYGWGWNDRGQVGIGVRGPHTATCSVVASDASTPWCSPEIRQVVTAGTSMNGRIIRQIAAGDRHSFAVATDGTAYAWGANDSGQLAIGSSAPYVLAPEQMIFSPKSISY